ncbi:MAG: hypothetical protein GKS06_04140 [Acidobacteria bacterium]|nr:hypothetical protein [Acidobacteriota bacterium]
MVEETDVDGRINVVTQTAATQMSFDLSPRLNLNLGGAARRLAYGDGDTAPENELARRQDRDEILLSASLDRRMTLKTSLGLFAGLRRSDFQSASSFRDNDRFRGGLRVVFGERGTTLLNRTVQGGSEPLEGAIESGVEIIDLAAEGRDDFSGLFARGVLRFGVRPKLGVWAGGEARSTPTFWQNNTYAINRGVGTGVDFPLVAGVTAGLFVDYTRIRYPELATFTQDDGTIFTGIREDNLLLYRGLLSVPIFGTRIGITGGWFDRRSNFDIATNRGYFLRIGLGTSFAINERI